MPFHSPSDFLQAESSLYSELDKLSAAWESLDRQLKTKVYDLAGLEERVSKSVVEVSRLFDVVIFSEFATAC